MKSFLIALHFGLLTALISAQLFAKEQMPAPHDGQLWSREQAQVSARSVEAEPILQTLRNLTVAGSSTDVLELLETTRTREDWPAPARDAAVAAYVHSLQDLPNRSVPRDVLLYLQSYEPGTMVPHEDHPAGLVPFINVAAAAHGLENRWLRLDARLEGLALLRSNPRSLADAFLIETNQATRRGYLEALKEADPAQLVRLNEEMEVRLGAQPALSELAALAAVRTGDLPAMLTVLDEGQGSAVAQMLRESPQYLSNKHARRLLLTALDSPNRTSAALAIAELSNATRGDSAVDSALAERLADPNIGAAAALALARRGAVDTLEAAAQSEDASAAQRARFALSLDPTMLNDGRVAP